MRLLIVQLSVFVITSYPCISLQAQQDSLPPKRDTIIERDVNDILRSIFNKSSATTKRERKTAVTLLPILGYNPSFGFNVGVNLMAGVRLGHLPYTINSVFNVSASYSTKEIAILRARHNMFTPGNKWNWQGDWQFAKMGIVDYGIGTGQGRNVQEVFNFNDLPTKSADSAFPIRYNY